MQVLHTNALRIMILKLYLVTKHYAQHLFFVSFGFRTIKNDAPRQAVADARRGVHRQQTADNEEVQVVARAVDRAARAAGRQQF